MKLHTLDANALYRFLIGGPGAEIVGSLFKEARDTEQPLRISIINWGEVYYTMARAKGLAETAKVMERTKLLPLSIVDAGEPITVSAARLKASYGLPYADCFAAAVAVGGILVTSDVKDFKKVPGLQLLPLPEHRPRKNPNA